MFINCKKALEFTNPETGEVCRFPRGYLGSAPEWVTKLWYFGAAVKDATITYVGDAPKPASQPPSNPPTEQPPVNASTQPPHNEPPESDDGKPKAPPKVTKQ